MNALRRAWAALAGFLRGFLGVPRRSDGFAEALDARCVHDPSQSAPTPACVRDALAARAATRGNCC